MNNTNSKSFRYNAGSRIGYDEQMIIADNYHNRFVTISESKDAVRECQDLFSANEYAVVVLNLGLGQRVINRVVFPLINKTRLNIRHIFKSALMCDASSIIVLMNQPEQYFYLSEQDRQFYETLKRVGNSLSVHVLDYIFFSQQGSFISNENEKSSKPNNSGFCVE